MKYAIILPLVALLFSCSPNFYCKKCSEKGKVIHDTITVVKDVPVPSVRVDTVTVYDLSTDTVVITKDRLTIKYKKLPGDTIFLAGECAIDTLRIEVPVHIATEIKTGVTKTRHIAVLVIVSILALVVGAFIGKIAR